MLKYYVPPKTNKLVTLSRWIVSYGLSIWIFQLMMKLHTWWSMVLLIPGTIIANLLGTMGINFLLRKTQWGRSYLIKRYNLVAAQKAYLKTKGESGDDVYGDSGEFAGMLMVGIAILLNIVCLLGWLFDPNFRL